MILLLMIRTVRSEKLPLKLPILVKKECNKPHRTVFQGTSAHLFSYSNINKDSKISFIRVQLRNILHFPDCFWIFRYSTNDSQ